MKLTVLLFPEVKTLPIINIGVIIILKYSSLMQCVYHAASNEIRYIP